MKSKKQLSVEERIKHNLAKIKNKKGVGIMEGVTKMDIEPEKAKDFYKEYKELLKERELEKKKEYEELKQAYYHISKGKKIINIFDAMKKAGKNEMDDPKLAICNANSQTVTFEKDNRGSGIFYGKNNKFNQASIQIPSDIFEDWKIQEGRTGTSRWHIERQLLETGVPIVPPHLLPKGKLENYYILWEVETWKDLAPKKDDPFLLKRISPNLFAVLAEWDVTELESSIVESSIIKERDGRSADRW